MILTRRGNKRRIAGAIIPKFPDHSLYIELFFGAGGMFFSKDPARRSIVNDSDAEVYNLFKVVAEQGHDLAAAWDAMPVHESLWREWVSGTIPDDPVMRACRFILLSNYSFLGNGRTMRFANGNAKQIVLDALDGTRDRLRGVEFMCCHWRDVIRRIPKTAVERGKAFVYADPPYLGTSHNYAEGFKEADTRELFATLALSGLNFMVSEFDHPVVLECALTHGLEVTIIGERHNLKNRRTEVVVTNYPLPKP
jgi:DNA adenine methylase